MNACAYPTPIIDGRHAYCQLASQGQPRIPVPSAGWLRSPRPDVGSHHRARLGGFGYQQPVPQNYQQGYVGLPFASMGAEPVHTTFIPVEQSGITSISSPDGWLRSPSPDVGSYNRAMLGGFGYQQPVPQNYQQGYVGFPFASMGVEPVHPKFIPVEQSGITSISSPGGYKFGVVSYNILAQAYVKSNFQYAPEACLRWEARSQAILTVLKNFGADFLCLQELDEYDTFYKGNMERYGYPSIYMPRNGQKPDGCGVFYKQGSAELLLQETIEYNDLVNYIGGETSPIVKDGDVTLTEQGDGSAQEGAKEDRGDPDDLHVRLKRDSVGIMAAFRLCHPSRRVLIIANTHIYWDPKLVDVKLAQAKYLLSCLHIFKTRVSKNFECTPSVIVTGDFNSTPGDPVYNYLTSGCSSLKPTVECPDESHAPLTSVYACTKGEPVFTNCTPDFTATLDYIFFSPSNGIQPVSFLEVPGPDSPSVTGGLPNYQHPSDHLPIGAEFEVSQ